MKTLNIENKCNFIVCINPDNKDAFFREAKKEGLNFKVCSFIKSNPRFQINVTSFWLEINENSQDKIERTRCELDRLQLKYLK